MTSSRQTATLLPSSEAILEFLNEADDDERYDYEVTHVPTGQGTEVLKRRGKTGAPADTRTFYRPDLRKLEDQGYVRRRGNRLSIMPTGKQAVAKPRR